MNADFPLHPSTRRVGFPLVLVVASLVLVACSATITTEGDMSIESVSLLDRLPAGANAVAWLDFEALVEALPPEDWAEYEQMLEDEDSLEDLERFIEATGMDPRTDLRQMVFAALPHADGPDDYLVLLAADFDEDKLLDLAGGAESVTYEGVTFYDAQEVFERLEEAVDRDDSEPQEPAEPGDERPGYLAILDAETLALGTMPSLETAVDVGAGRGDGLGEDARMRALIDDVDDEGQIWLVATRDTWRERVGDLGPGGAMVPTNAIESIETMTLSMRMGDGLDLRVSGTAGDAAAATELTTSINGLLAMGRMMMQQSEPELFGIIDRGITVVQEDRIVRIEVALSEADIEVLRRMAEEQTPQ